MRSWSASAWTLVVVNLWELAGVLCFGWDPLLLAGRGSTVQDTRGLRIAEKCLVPPFFLLHDGLFTLMHGVALNAMWKGLGAGKQPGAAASLFALLFSSPPAAGWRLWTAIALLFYSHGYSFLAHRIARKEYRRLDVSDTMVAP